MAGTEVHKLTMHAMQSTEMKSRAVKFADLIKQAYRHQVSLDLAIFAGALALYMHTLCRSVYTFDSAEFAAGAYSLGIVHATGYPLYLLLAKLFTLIIPFGDIAYRVNLLSATCAALSLVVIRRLAFRITGSHRSALFSCLLFGLSFPFWSEAVIAEVYTLHMLFISLILSLVLAWKADGKESTLLALGLVTGLSFSHHMATILILPGIAYLIWQAIRSGSVRNPGIGVWIKTCLAGLIGPLFYLYLPIRYAANPELNYARHFGVDLSSLKGILWMVRGAMFSNQMFGYTFAEIPKQFWDFLQLSWQAFVGIGLLIAAVGIYAMGKRDKPLLTALTLIFTANVIFYVNYRVFDKATMFLPAFLVVALWIASGTTFLLHTLKEARSRQVLSWTLVGVLAITLSINYPLVNLRNNTITRQFALEVFQQAPEGAMIVGAWVDITPLIYMQIVEDRREDIYLFDHGLYIIGRQSVLSEKGISKETSRRIAENEVRLEVASQLMKGRPVFSLGANTVLDPYFSMEPVTNWLFAVRPLDHERFPR